MTDQLPTPGSEDLTTMREWLDGYRAQHPVHVLVVTEEDGDLTYRIECPGVTDGCRCWWECMDCQRRLREGDEALEDQLDETGEAHGVEHQNLASGWSAKSDDCYGENYDELTQAAEDAFLGERPEPGRYQVRLIPDEESMELELVTEESEAKLNEALARHEARQG